MENMGGSPGDSSVVAAVPAGRDDSGEAARSAAPLKSGSPRVVTYTKEDLDSKIRRLRGILRAWEIWERQHGSPAQLREDIDTYVWLRGDEP